MTAVAFGLLPALLAGGADLHGALQQGGRSTVDAARAPVREALVVTQLALATMLVVAAALLGQSFLRLQSVALGFQPDQLVTARISFPDWGDEESHPEDHVLLDALLAEVRALPGVVSAGMSSEIPLGEVDTTMAAAAQRIAPGGEEGVQASWRTVTPDYLSTLGIPLRRGRWFQDSGEHHRSVLVSEALARRVWPDGADPVGRQVWLSNGQAYNVVGLVGDSRQLGLAEGVTPTIYMSSTWVILPTMNLLVRTAGDPDALAGALRQVTARLSPDRPFFDVRTMSAVIAGSVAEPRLQTVVVALFAGVGLLLAAVGAAGVVAYGVVQRTPELAVRGALGASPGRLLRHVLRRGVVLCGAGVGARPAPRLRPRRRPPGPPLRRPRRRAGHLRRHRPHPARRRHRRLLAPRPPGDADQPEPGAAGGVIGSVIATSSPPPARFRAVIVAAVLLGDAAGDREAEAGAGVVGREVGVEDPRQDLGRHARARCRATAIRAASPSAAPPAPSPARRRRSRRRAFSSRLRTARPRSRASKRAGSGPSAARSHARPPRAAPPGSPRPARAPPPPGRRAWGRCAGCEL